jgi:branched-chain amino acid transport system permease protein
VNSLIDRLKGFGWTGALWIAAFVVLFGMGLVDGSPFLINAALTIMIYMIFAVGLNIVVGYTGLLDLGYASFMAIGAFVISIGLVLTNQEPQTYEGANALPVRKLILSQDQLQLEPKAGGEVVVRVRQDQRYDVVSGAEAVLAAKAAEQRKIEARHMTGLALPVGQQVAKGDLLFHFPGGFLILILLAGLVCGAVGLARGFPTLRLTGDYYAIVTLGFAEIVWLVTLNEDWLTGGAFGIKLSSKYRPQVLGDALYEDTWQFYYLVFICLLCAILFAYRLQHSRLGRSWAAIKADETAAMASGIDVDRAKMLSFAASGFLGGVGGALFAIKLGTVTATQFEVWQSILVVCCLVLGGMGTIGGALLGAVIVSGMGEGLRLLSDPGVVGETLALPPQARFLVYGLILVVLMRFRPQGLLPPRADSPPPTDEEMEAIRSAPCPLFHMGEAQATEGAAA